jgi:hypothetical protein
VTASHAAIQTRYAGCHFRSHLEARWAVFFDTLHIKWQYEPEGFEVNWRLGDAPSPPKEINSIWVHDSFAYLPDFWLPDLDLRVEVKGSLTDDVKTCTGRVPIIKNAHWHIGGQNIETGQWVADLLGVEIQSYMQGCLAPCRPAKVL